MSMRVRWREFELPNRVELDDETKSDTYGRFVVEPFERGFGATVGNSLRRVLLSSIEGAALVRCRVDGVDHEFSTKPGVYEDIAYVALNLKNVLVRLGDTEEAELYVKKSGKGPITVADIEYDSEKVEVVDNGQVIATLTDDVEFSAILLARKGRGYSTSVENSGGENEIGNIWLDSTFSPVTRVRYRVENTRVGQRTNYDKLILEIWTNGTVAPNFALVQAAKILRKHLNPFVKYTEIGTDTVQPRIEEPEVEVHEEPEELKERLDRAISSLDLSVRSSNCLESENFTTLRDICSRTEEEMLRIRNFGQTSLVELKEKLDELDLRFGMISKTATSVPNVN